MNEVRQHKLESLIQREISTYIVSGVIKDPRVGSFLGVSRVKLSRDGSFARIHVSSWVEQERIEKAVEGLNHAQGFLSHLLARKLDLRIVPKLVFVHDPSISEALDLNRRIDQLLHPQLGGEGVR